MEPKDNRSLFELWNVLLIGAVVVAFFSSGQLRAASLKNKSDAELFHLVAGGRNDQMKKNGEEANARFVPNSFIDSLWEMSPPDAALAFASTCVEKEAQGQAKFSISREPGVSPPPAGEIGIRWVNGNYYAPPERGMTVLEWNGDQSRICLSDFQILGPVSNGELEKALAETDQYPLRPLVAQRTYEILWWLGRVHRVGDWVGGSSSVSTDDWFQSFWMTPDGPYMGNGILGTPNGEDLEDENYSSFPAFAYLLVRRLTQREGIKPRQPLPKIGHHVDANPDAEFLRVHPRPEKGDQATVRQWVQQITAILRNPDRHKLYSDVLSALVPTEEPLRYKDAEIDRALLELMRNENRAAAVHEKAAADLEQQEKNLEHPDDPAKRREWDDKWHALSRKAVDAHAAAWDVRGAADHAAELLGFRDHASVFDELLNRSENPSSSGSEWTTMNQALTGAAALAGKHPALRPRLIAYLSRPLANIRSAKAPVERCFDSVWRADLRDLQPDLEKLATSSAEEDEDPSVSISPPPETGNRKFHYARVILLAWRETDPLTKIKLDAMINGYVGGSNSIPDFLQKEFDDLPSNDQTAFRNFITWLRSIDDVPWSRKLLEDIFTPHTPRPHDPFED